MVYFFPGLYDKETFLKKLGFLCCDDESDARQLSISGLKSFSLCNRAAFEKMCLFKTAPTKAGEIVSNCQDKCFRSYKEEQEIMIKTWEFIFTYPTSHTFYKSLENFSNSTVSEDCMVITKGEQDILCKNVGVFGLSSRSV